MGTLAGAAQWDRRPVLGGQRPDWTFGDASQETIRGIKGRKRYGPMATARVSDLLPLRGGRGAAMRLHSRMAVIACHLLPFLNGFDAPAV